MTAGMNIRPFEPNRDFWDGRRVAVTGATGFVGTHLTSALAALGARVVVLVRDTVPSSPIRDGWWPKVSIVTGAVEDQSLMERMLGEYDVATVFHLAAQTQVGVANRNPVATYEANVGGTWAVLEAARRSSTVRQIVTASSDKAYGEQTVLPYTEDMPLLASKTRCKTLVRRSSAARRTRHQDRSIAHEIGAEARASASMTSSVGYRPRSEAPIRRAVSGPGASVAIRSRSSRPREVSSASNRATSGSAMHARLMGCCQAVSFRVPLTTMPQGRQRHSQRC
jgi:NAD(P)-dependent dehydrogenase (short-subunit alcohol dehydrogenase family)